jgi:protein TonB
MGLWPYWSQAPGRFCLLKVSMMIHGSRLVLLVSLIAFSSVCGQTANPAQAIAPPKAVYTPQPVYRPEWVKQGLKGKGVALVMIDNTTGKVTDVKMLDSTGNKLLDDAALKAYSQWRFVPGTGSRVKIPIEFTNRPNPQAMRRPQSQPSVLYGLLFLLGLAGLLLVIRRRKVVQRSQ